MKPCLLYWGNILTPGFWRVDAIRYTPASYSDSIDHESGYLGVTAHWEHPLRERLTLSIGLGPVLIFQETWNTVPGYRDDGYYQESARFLKGRQYKLIVGADGFAIPIDAAPARRVEHHPGHSLRQHPVSGDTPLTQHIRVIHPVQRQPDRRRNGSGFHHCAVRTAHSTPDDGQAK